MPFHVQRDVGGGCRVVGQQTLAAMKTGNAAHRSIRPGTVVTTDRSGGHRRSHPGRRCIIYREFEFIAAAISARTWISDLSDPAGSAGGSGVLHARMGDDRRLCRRARGAGAGDVPPEYGMQGAVRCWADDDGDDVRVWTHAVRRGAARHPWSRASRATTPRTRTDSRCVRALQTFPRGNRPGTCPFPSRTLRSTLAGRQLDRSIVIRQSYRAKARAEPRVAAGRSHTACAEDEKRRRSSCTAPAGHSLAPGAPGWCFTLIERVPTSDGPDRSRSWGQTSFRRRPFFAFGGYILRPRWHPPNLLARCSPASRCSAPLTSSPAQQQRAAKSTSTSDPAASWRSFGDRTC